MLAGAQNSASSYLLGPGWPGEKSRVLAEGVQLHPFIMWPHNVLETWFLVGDRGHVRVPRQETILMAHQHPAQGGDQSEKLRFFGVAKLLGAPPNQAPHALAK